MLRSLPPSIAALRQPGAAILRHLTSEQGHGRFGGLAETVGLWIERSRTRRALAFLDDRQLEDLGLTRADQRQEGSKPFWRT